MKVAIVGVGLIGGSLGLALKTKGLASKVIGIGRNKESLKKAEELGCVDFATDDLKGVKDADLIFLATPPLAIIEIGKKISEFARESIITDVGSTKERIVNELSPILPKFIGSHPMAGSHRQGSEAASASLFSRSLVVITPTKDIDSIKEKVSCLWEKVGARVIEMDAEEHDRIVGLSSHIPHILSFSLVNLVKRGNAETLVSTGFTDMARLSLSPPSLWNEICLTNKSNILSGLSKMKDIISEWQEAIKKGDILEKFQETQKEAMAISAQLSANKDASSCIL
ncbi:MAG: prephenate dehydrogenase [bacterium]|nr:prephenate dehydrogenase [bacterium]